MANDKDNNMKDMLNAVRNRHNRSNATPFRRHEPQRKSQISHHQRKPEKPVTHKVQHKSAPAKKADTDDEQHHMINWSLMLDYRTVAIINALEKLYNKKNRDEVVHMLFHHNLKSLVHGKGDEGYKHYKMYKEVFELTTRNKAIKRHQKYYGK